MNRFWKQAAVLALLLAAAPALADDTVAEPTYQAPWYKRWFGIGPDAPKPPPAKKPNVDQQARVKRALAEANYMRRLAVIDELKSIALETRNDELMHKAESLEKKAFELYQQQTAGLPLNQMMPSTDERLLEKQLDLGAGSTASATRKLDQPSGNSTGAVSQASAIREVKP
ncbi:MAG TPA: hypothetical protein VGZ47_14460 [Gemmataceae bacterium]|jgi:hypothetical protein|nr:hypothetical protein [Gemmataceae bacterium]